MTKKEIDTEVVKALKAELERMMVDYTIIAKLAGERKGRGIFNVAIGNMKAACQAILEIIEKVE